MKYKVKNYLLFILAIIIVITSFSYKVSPIYADIALDNAQADKLLLEKELSILEKEIQDKQKELDSQKGESTIISKGISSLKAQITKAKRNIASKNTIIKKLGGEINKKTKQIKFLNTKIENEKDSLAQLIRKEREIDNKSIFALILSKDMISSIYGDINIFASIKNSIKKSVKKIRNTKSDTEEIKKTLEIKKVKEIDTKIKLETDKKKVERTKINKQKDLSLSKNKEKAYQNILNEKAKRRNEILTALFQLRDDSSIPFSEALVYAKLASDKTGVRPAFLLAISTQESGSIASGMVGINLGGCYLKNKTTGSGVYIKSNKFVKNVMKASRDVLPFIKLTTELGRNPYKTAISCPYRSGYGGAMGPLQFITSTWNIVKGKAATYLGINKADPWNPKDAFMAAAILLKGNGAISGNYKAERDAACRYYSGRSCSAPKVKNLFYGNAVMTKAKIIQKNIDLLQD